MSQQVCLHVAFEPHGKDSKYELPVTKYLSPKIQTNTTMAAYCTPIFKWSEFTYVIL